MNKKQLIVAWVIGINFVCLSVGLAQSELEVSGIYYDEKGQSYAIVNGSISKVGSIVNEAKIIEINKDFVRFENKTGLFDKRIAEKVRKQQQGEMSRKNWLSDSVQSIITKIRDIFGVKKQDKKVSAVSVNVVPKEKELKVKQAVEQAEQARLKQEREEQIRVAEQKRQEELVRRAEELKQKQAATGTEQERLSRLEVRRLNDVARQADYATKKKENKILASQYRIKAEKLLRNSPEMAKELFLQAIECYKNVISYSVNIDEKLITESIIEEINRQIQGIENVRIKGNH